MPIYEYECEKCGQKFEMRRSIADSDREIRCPNCGETAPRRIFSTFGTTSSSSGCAPSTAGGST